MVIYVFAMRLSLFGCSSYCLKHSSLITHHLLYILNTSPCLLGIIHRLNSNTIALETLFILKRGEEGGGRDRNREKEKEKEKEKEREERERKKEKGGVGKGFVRDKVDSASILSDNWIQMYILYLIVIITCIATVKLQ